MHSFHYRNGKLYCEGVSVQTLAEKYGTPLYIYSQATLADHFQKLNDALRPLDHRICFAVKANSNLAVLRVLVKLGAAFDIVSQGELRRVLAAGGSGQSCLFAGVGKTEAEIEFALRQNIYCFNTESPAELDRISRIAVRLKKIAPIGVRINPNVDAHTHAKVTTGTYRDKFGIQLEEVEALFAHASRLPNLRLRGAQMHIGSQLTQTKPYELAVKKVLPLVTRLTELYGLEFFSIGGGLGIVYNPALVSGTAAWWKSSQARALMTPARYAQRLTPLLKPLGLTIVVEPGRFIVGNAGILVTQVQYVKQTGRKNFVIVDAAMNDLIRPAMYDSYHEIVPMAQRNGKLISSDVVGPICESADYFCKDRPMPKVGESDYLAVLSAGAYGFVMASNYNARPLAAEVLVHGREASVIRRRQELPELWAAEKIPAWLR
jgi:diaminopimelate decarboxylase